MSGHCHSLWVRITTFCVVCCFFTGSLPCPGQGEPPPAGASGSRLISLNFRDAPLDQVLSFYAELTGRTMIKSPGVNATITLRGQTRLTQAESLQAIESILAMHNVTLVPMGEKFFKVVQINSARQHAMAFSGEMPEEVFEETDHLISQLIQLKYLQASEVQSVIQGLLHGYGKIQILERINSMLITDTSANLQRVIEILGYIDRPIETRAETRIYEIRYAQAAKIAGRLNELIQHSQKDKKEQKAQVKLPREKAPPGIIRARRAAPTAQAEVIAADLAERGIIQGEVKIIADDRTNILIVISEPQNFVFFDKIISVLDRPVDPEISVRVVALEFADAEEISGILNEFIGAAKAEKEEGVAGAGEGGEGGARSTALEEYIAKRVEARKIKLGAEEKAKIGQLSEATKILADKRTNSLLLMGRKADIAALMDVIEELDVMLAQVLIEVVILEVSLNDNIEYGMSWLQRSMTVYNEEVKGPGGGIGVRQPVFSFGGGQSMGGGETFIDASTVGRDISLSPGALTYYATFFDLNIDAILRLAAGSSDARILSTPVILTTDNTEAKIIVGEERPVVTATTTSTEGANTSQYEYRNIGIDLAVTPRINPERFVVMEIAQSADALGGTVQIDNNDVPIITKRQLQAEIGVRSESTIALGGLISTDKRLARTKIPLLGDIPLLGALFRSDRKDWSRRELLVLITPYVLTTPEEARAETVRLHKASRAGEVVWPKNWSKSELSVLDPKDAKEQEKAAKELRRKLEAERKKALRRKKVDLSENTTSSVAEPLEEQEVTEPFAQESLEMSESEETGQTGKSVIFTDWIVDDSAGAVNEQIPLRSFSGESAESQPSRQAPEERPEEALRQAVEPVTRAEPEQIAVEDINAPVPLGR